MLHQQAAKPCLQKSGIELESHDYFKEGTETIADMAYPPSFTIGTAPENPLLSAFSRIFAQKRLRGILTILRDKHMTWKDVALSSLTEPYGHWVARPKTPSRCHRVLNFIAACRMKGGYEKMLDAAIGRTTSRATTITASAIAWRASIFESVPSPGLLARSARSRERHSRH